MTDRVPTLCDQCGQTDDHPKIHGTATVPSFNDDGSAVLDEHGQQVSRPSSKHHDCLSFQEERVAVASGQEKGAPKVSAIIDAAKGGTRGAKLLDLILSGDLPKATGKGGRNDG